MAVRPAAIAVRAGARPRSAAWTVVARFVRKKPLGAAGGALMLVMVVTAIFADLLQTHDPIATNAAYTLGSPNVEHWLGTDHLGRDIYSRIVHGARVSLVVGVASTLLGSVLGGIIGLLSGYIGGTTDLITQRILDILQGLPLLVLALVMSAALGPSVQNVVIAISSRTPRGAACCRSPPPSTLRRRRTSCSSRVLRSASPSSARTCSATRSAIRSIPASGGADAPGRGRRAG